MTVTPGSSTGQQERWFSVFCDTGRDGDRLMGNVKHERIITWLGGHARMSRSLLLIHAMEDWLQKVQKTCQLNDPGGGKQLLFHSP